MALASTTIFEVRQGASDLNGGGYNPSRSVNGVDRSQQDAAHVVIDGATISSVAGPTSGANITLTGHTVADADLGNLVNISGVCYEITAVNTGSNYWTLDRDTGASVDTPLTGRMGGAMASPAKAAGAGASGGTIYVKGGTYDISTNTANVATGKISLPAGTVTAPSRLIGYTSTRTPTNTDAKPVIRCGTGITGTMVTQAGNYCEFYNLDIDANSKTIQMFTDIGGWSRISRCRFHGVSGGGIAFIAAAASITTLCEFDTNVGGVQLRFGGHVSACHIHDNAGLALYAFVAGATIADTIVSATTNATSTEGAVYVAAGNVTFKNVVIQGSTGNGLYIASGWISATNTIVSGSTLYGMTAAAGASGNMNRLRNCAGYSNTSGHYNATSFPVVEGFVTLTADPFVSAASGNFALNSTAGGGAACKAAGIPGAFPGGLTTGYLDIGAAQSLSSTAGYPRRPR